MSAAGKQVSLYDTTLRDGTQGEGFQLSGLDKLRIAHRLDEFGVDYIEGGWPGSNPKDVEFFKAAAGEEWKHARIAAFGADAVVVALGLDAHEDDPFQGLAVTTEGFARMAGRIAGLGWRGYLYALDYLAACLQERGPD